MIIIEVDAVADGEVSWWKHGELHRDNNQPACYWDDGTIEWYIDGQFIKANKPTIPCDPK